MKKKGNKKTEEKPKEKEVDTNILLSELNKYLKVSEEEQKKKDLEKAKENEEFDRLAKENNNLLSDLETLNGKQDYEGLLQKATEILNKISEKETQLSSLKMKNESLSKEVTSTNTNMINLNVHLAELERINKLSLQKLSELNDEKKRIIQEEKNKFAEIKTKCENFVNDFKQKIESSVPDKASLVKENEELKAKLENAMQNAKELKETLENQIKEKDNYSQIVEEGIKNEIKTKFEEITMISHKTAMDNMELKNQNMIYSKKFEEVNASITQSGEIFSKMKDEIQKRNTRINQLEKENAEIKNKDKKAEQRYNELGGEIEKLKAENDTVFNQVSELSVNLKALSDKLTSLKNTQK